VYPREAFGLEEVSNQPKDLKKRHGISR
jgi:hypothetical protein